MLKLRSSIVKEILVLIRDKAGLAILFSMPMVLIFVMTLIQDSTFRKLDETNLQILMVDKDQDSLGKAIENGLSLTGFFSVATSLNGQQLSEKVLQQNISDGNYQIGIVIEKGATAALRNKAKTVIEKALIIKEEDRVVQETEDQDSATIIIYFDPVIQNSFKQSMVNALDNYASKVESKIIFQAFAKEIQPLLPEESDLSFIGESGLSMKQTYASNKITMSCQIPYSIMCQHGQFLQCFL